METLGRSSVRRLHWLGRPHRGLDHPQAVEAEHQVERAAEQGVTVVDQELARGQDATRRDHEVARLLAHRHRGRRAVTRARCTRRVSSSMKKST
jgi:predicted metal-dependent phosphoesterase TrpH